MLTVQKPYDPESFNNSEYPDYHHQAFKLPSPTLSSESSKSENLSSLDEDYVLEFINTELMDKHPGAQSGGTPEMNGLVCKKEATPDFIPSPQHSSFNDISADGTHSSISGSNISPNMSGIIAGTESDSLSPFDAQTSHLLHNSVDDTFLNLIPDLSIPPPYIPTLSDSAGSNSDPALKCPQLTQPTLTNVMMPTTVAFDPKFDLNNFAAVLPPNQLSPILSLPSTLSSPDTPVSTVALSCEKLLADKRSERSNKKRKTSDESANDGLKLKPAKPKLSPEEKKQQRLIKNRQAALESRKRQKEHVESLESHAHQLIEENKNLHQQIALLNSQISFLASLNPSYATSTPTATPSINPAVVELEGFKSENAKLVVENQQLKSENDELRQKNKELEMLLNICSVPQLPHILPKSSTINTSTIPSSSIPMVPMITRTFDATEANVAHGSELTAASGTTRTRGKPNIKKLSAAFLSLIFTSTFFSIPFQSYFASSPSSTRFVNLPQSSPPILPSIHSGMLLSPSTHVNFRSLPPSDESSDVSTNVVYRGLPSASSNKISSHVNFPILSSSDKVKQDLPSRYIVLKSIDGDSGNGAEIGNANVAGTLPVGKTVTRIRRRRRIDAGVKSNDSEQVVVL